MHKNNIFNELLYSKVHTGQIATTNHTSCTCMYMLIYTTEEEKLITYGNYFGNSNLTASFKCNTYNERQT